MKVLILGGGLLGVTTAYVLASRGHTVELLERNAACGAETSFANGGQLSYSHAEPWGNPHVLKKLPGWLIRPDSPLIFRPRLDPDMIRWGLRFLRECSGKRADANAINILRLNLYSRLKTNEILEKTGIKIDYSGKGILHLFSTEGEFDHAKRYVDFEARFGCSQSVLTRDEVLTKEPVLLHTDRALVGGIHSHMDASADALMFCRELAEHCVQKLGVTIHYNASASDIDADGEFITGIRSPHGVHTADAYVMAAGPYSMPLMKTLGVNIPVYPMKGYSITLPANEYTPGYSLTDGFYKIVFSRLGDRLRVAGTAEFAGFDTRVIESRIAPIVKAAKSMLPRAAWDEPMTSWACLRPSTPTGAPLLGPTRYYRNLFLNTGHGTLGWTQAAGSAHIVADLIDNKRPEIILTGLAAHAV